jgi:intraflagellar transport protein 52
LLVFLGEGGQEGYETNINFLLEDFGITFKKDAVVCTVFEKYFHPKEALISSGILNREINRAAGKKVSTGIRLDSDGAVEGVTDDQSSNLSFVFPYGVTLGVKKPAVPVLSSGHLAYPLNQPICALCDQATGTRGRVAAMGSTRMIHDSYFTQEENAKLMDVIIAWCLQDPSIKLNKIDAEEPDLSDAVIVPESKELASRLRSCLQESEDVPRDFTQLFDDTIFSFDLHLVPLVLERKAQLRVKHEPLTLIPPQFETPLPSLQPAVFPPILKEPPAPNLDLFDLDEQFASSRVRMAQLTNKCKGDNDLEYYIKECGDILGINDKLSADKKNGRHVLEYVMRQLVQFKKLQ